MTKSLQNVETFHRLLCSSIMTININTLSRAHFISTALEQAGVDYTRGCQCPISGALHFYRTTLLLSWVNSAVSMPYLGRTSFLRKRKTSMNIYYIVCQCPISGALHFYAPTFVIDGVTVTMCQCPISGALHFYSPREKWDTTQKSVNALSRAHFISTPTLKIT